MFKSRPSAATPTPWPGTAGLKVRVESSVDLAAPSFLSL